MGLGLTPEQICHGILERERGEAISYGVSDPAIFQRNGGPSIGETMAIHGVAWRRGDNKRIPGWEQVRSRLSGAAVDGAVVPTLYVADTCQELIRCLPAMQHDSSDAEDLDTDGEDHCVDALRYGCMSRPVVRSLSPEKPPSRSPTKGMTINELFGLDDNNRVIKR